MEILECTPAVANYFSIVVGSGDQQRDKDSLISQALSSVTISNTSRLGGGGGLKRLTLRSVLRTMIFSVDMKRSTSVLGWVSPSGACSES